MSKRERIEDLGRVCEILHTILDMDVFRKLSKTHGKNLASIFNELSDAEKREELEMLAFEISDLQEEIQEAWAICRYGDQNA